MPLPANSLSCSVPFNYAELDEPESDPVVRDCFAEKLEFARWLLSYISSKDKCRLTVDCLRLALGDADLEAYSMTDLGRKHGITKAAVCKRVRETRTDLHLPPNANNKSAHASRRYSETNRSPLRLDKRSA